MKKETKDFLSRNKEYIFSYFKENPPFFSGCCADIARGGCIKGGVV